MGKIQLGFTRTAHFFVGMTKILVIVRQYDSSPFVHSASNCIHLRKSYLSEYTDDEDVLIAGLLHDVLEDADPSEYTKQTLEDIFGKRVVSIMVL